MIIAIDADGTCWTHDFPNMGTDIGAAPVLKKLVKNGHQLILHTMRSDREIAGGVKDDKIADVTGLFLTDALNWFKENDIPLYDVNNNPTQHTWTTSRKIYAHMYVDDAALGIPLIYGKHERPYVDWEGVELLLTQRGLI